MQTIEDKGLALLDRTIFTYAISHLSSSDKVRFYYALKGRKGDAGIVAKLRITQLGKTVLLCDCAHDKLLSEFLASWGCKYSYLPICVREEQPTNQMVSPDTIGTELEDEASPSFPERIEGVSALTASSGIGKIPGLIDGANGERSRMIEAIALRHARAKPTPKYPLKMGTVKRISLSFGKEAMAKGRRIEDRTPSEKRNKEIESAMQRRQELVNTLIERQTGIGRVSAYGIEWLSANSLPALDENNSMYLVQETALIKQKNHGICIAPSKSSTGTSRALRPGWGNPRDAPASIDKRISTLGRYTNTNQAEGKGTGHKKDRNERRDDGMEVRRTP
ncbi:MAG: hypothetical protein AABX47_00370 [Nanoarchaeota archaeon]